MQFLIFVPVFFIFLYALYSLAKDDYVLIRKNISTENLFDIAFLVGVGSIIISRLVYFLLHPISNQNIFLLIFSLKGGFSLLGGFLGGVLLLYFIAKYQKIPLGRLFDFFALSFLIALPFGFLGNAALFIRSALIFSLVNMVVYVVFWIIFFKLLYPKLMNRTFKDGTLSLFFFILFSFVLLFTENLIPLKRIALLSLVTAENIGLVVFFLICIVLLFRQEQGKSRRRS